MTPHHPKVVVLFINLRSLPLTLMIHFVNVQTSKLEQYMQVYVWYDTEEMKTMGTYVSYYIGQQM